MSSIINDKKNIIYVIKESGGGENKVFNIIEKLILKDIKNNLRSALMILYQINMDLRQLVI